MTKAFLFLSHSFLEPMICTGRVGVLQVIHGTGVEVQTWIVTIWYNIPCFCNSVSLLETTCLTTLREQVAVVANG
jgi:hypothetical protein